MKKKKLVVLSVGYGKGHHSAAQALVEYYLHQGWEAQVYDVCEMAHPGWFALTQRFYACCVRYLPWLWRVTYDLTETADWSRLVKGPVLRRVTRCLEEILEVQHPDLVICTYPLFAYMLDALQPRRKGNVPYAMVVTDAREISRPWMCSAAKLVVVPDAGSREMVINQYALERGRVVAAGFPVRGDFSPNAALPAPSERCLRVLYGAYRQTRGVVEDMRALLAAFPDIELTVLAGKRADYLKHVFSEYANGARLHIVQESNNMAEYIANSHLYIGKAGAATMFECYACQVPVLVNYTLPGQERGNLELLLEEGCGCHVESTAHMVSTLQWLLADDASGWRRLRNAMQSSRRETATRNIAQAICNKFGV